MPPSPCATPNSRIDSTTTGMTGLLHELHRIAAHPLGGATYDGLLRDDQP